MIIYGRWNLFQFQCDIYYRTLTSPLVVNGILRWAPNCNVQIRLDDFIYEINKSTLTEVTELLTGWFKSIYQARYLRAFFYGVSGIRDHVF